MRADRLVAILLMLQQRQRVTAAEVAEELEISERTARRDLEALGMAGLPVYSERGRGGGWRLLGGGRTDLSGLNSAEARALFLVAGASAVVTPELKAALRKLVRALPEPFRAEVEAASSSVVVDAGGWGRSSRPRRAPAHLDALQSAAATGSRLRLGYTDRTGKTTQRVVDPMGLVLKGTVWYLMAETEAGQRTFRVGRVTSVEPTGERVARPDSFDLADAWQEVVEHVDELRGPVEMTVLADPDLVDVLRWMFDRQAEIGATEPDGRLRVSIRGRHIEIMAAQVAGFGRRVEVIAPAEARRHLASLARELSSTYGGG